MNAVVKNQNVAVRQGIRSVLARQRRRAELPDNLAGPAIDADHSRGGPVTDQDIPVRKLEDAIPQSPQRPQRLDFGDAVLHGIHRSDGLFPLMDSLDRASTRRQCSLSSPRRGSRRRLAPPRPWENPM